MSKIIDEKQKDDFVKSLQDLGLTMKESSVYLSLLTLGEVGTTAIVNETGLHRQFVYDALESLEEKGLVGHTISRGRKKFTGRSPSKIVTMLDQKKRNAEEFVSRVEKSLIPMDLQEFEVYRGVESFVANEFEIIKSAKENSKICILGGVGDEYYKNMGKYLNEYEFIRKKKNIEVYYIGTVEQIKYLSEAKDTRSLFFYRTLPQALTGELNIIIYDDQFCFSMFGSPVTKILVKSPKIAKSYFDFFMGLWNISK